MIDVKEAVKIARSYVADLFSDAGGLALEEVEFSEEKGAWLITIGFSVREPQSPLDALGLKYDRKYKLIHVDAETGEVKSVKIRPVPHA